MSSPDDDLRDLIPPSRTYAAEIATVDTAAGTCTVLLRQIDGGRDRHGPAPYTPHPTAGTPTHPQRHDRCLAIEDDRGDLWVVAWSSS